MTKDCRLKHTMYLGERRKEGESDRKERKERLKEGRKYERKEKEVRKKERKWLYGGTPGFDKQFHGNVWFTAIIFDHILCNLLKQNTYHV